MNRKKLLTSVTAVALAAVLALGGTFAWQSINQTALNESSDDVNPGGRLHDDFDGKNKDVYVENFADEPIFARIRLTEYFEAVMNYDKGEEAEKTVPIIGTRTESTDAETGEKVVTRTGVVFQFDGHVNDDGTVNAGYDKELTVDEDHPLYWWKWTTGTHDPDEGAELVYYMPTFNLNKDSLVADVNGQYKTPGVITSQDYGQYTGYTEYEYEDEKKGIEIFDADLDSDDEVGSDFSVEKLKEKKDAGDIELYNALDAEGNAIYAEDGEGITHTAKPVGNTNGLISMADWLEIRQQEVNESNPTGYNPEKVGSYWVYDEDGWVYWSSPIEAGETTGRLLDSIDMTGVMDDSWYYKLTVEAQFVTADDVGKADNTGFYADGATVSTNAETLLATIGVTIPEGAAPGSEDTTDLDTLMLGSGASKALSQNDKVVLRTDGGQYPTSTYLKLTTDSGDLTEGTDYTYSNSNGVLTLLTADVCEITVTFTETQTATINANGYGAATSDNPTLKLKSEAGSTVNVQTGARVMLQVEGIDNLLENYSTTNSAKGLFKVAKADLGDSYPVGNVEQFSGTGWTMELDYENGTVAFMPSQALDSDSGYITYTKDGTTYVGSVIATPPASLPGTGGDGGGLPSTGT